MIVLGFPGVGKTELFKAPTPNNVTFMDSDSSSFSWLEPRVIVSPFPLTFAQ